MTASTREHAAEVPVEHRIEIGGVACCVFEWGGPSARHPETYLLAHATGFHARCWDPVVAQMPGRHVFAVDLRGHGRSGKVPITHWNVFGQDLAAVVAHFDMSRVVGVGHSMGGHAMVQAAAASPDRYERLVLIDPVIAAPETYRPGNSPWGELSGDEMHPTAKRKNAFASPQEMIDRFAERHPYALFTPEALRAYCTYGLLPTGEGDYALACPPETEASVYMTSRTNADVYRAISALRMPVRILRARPSESRDMMDFSASPTWPELHRQFHDATDELMDDLTHFMPMQEPARIARIVLGE